MERHQCDLASLRCQFGHCLGDIFLGEELFHRIIILRYYDIIVKIRVGPLRSLDVGPIAVLCSRLARG